MTATMAFCPAGSCSKLMSSIVLDLTIGFCGYTRLYISVSIRLRWFHAIVPAAERRDVVSNGGTWVHQTSTGIANRRNDLPLYIDAGVARRNALK